MYGCDIDWRLSKNPIPNRSFLISFFPIPSSPPIVCHQLDDVVASTTTGPRVEEAMWRSIRWLDRCISAHDRPKEQNLFAIIQGGLDAELRKKCADEMIKRDTPGYAIGGLSGGEAKDDFWKMVSQFALWRGCRSMKGSMPLYGAVLLIFLLLVPLILNIASRR